MEKNMKWWHAKNASTTPIDVIEYILNNVNGTIN